MVITLFSEKIILVLKACGDRDENISPKIRNVNLSIANNEDASPTSQSKSLLNYRNTCWKYVAAVHRCLALSRIEIIDSLTIQLYPV